jgi:hypothetical protein
MTPAPTPPTNPLNPVPPAPSPTGKPLLPTLPAWLTVVLGVICTGCLLTVLQASEYGVALPPLAKLLLSVVGSLGILYGIVNQGARSLPKLVVLLTAGLALAPLPAHAQSLTVGPSLPAFAITPGAGHPVTLAAGAGITVGADFFPTTLLEQKVAWLTVGFDFYGSLNSAAQGLAAVAVHACLLGLFCFGPGMKLLASDGTGALDGKLDHRSFLVMIEPDCRVMKLLWPAINAPVQADKPIDGDHPNGP